MQEAQMIAGHIAAVKPPPTHLTAPLTSLNSTGLSLVKAIARRQATGNLVFFPSSVHPVLAQLMAGARGETAEEIRRATQIANTPQFQQAFARFLNELRANQQFKLSIANSLWVQLGVPLDEDFLAVCESYGALLQGLDFEDPNGCVQAINDWAARMTEQKITEVVTPDLFSSLTRLVIACAVYFKGRWLVEFDPDDTTPENFTVDGAGSTRVMTMCRTGFYRALDADGFRVLEMPMKGNASMLVLVPDGGLSAASLLTRLSAQTIAALDDGLRETTPRRIKVHVPKFEIRSSIDLVQACRDLGIELLFDPQMADLSGMTKGGEPLFVSALLQKAWLLVNEEGAEGAAVTVAVATRMSAGGLPEFRVDRSFLALIREQTGAIISMARVINPAG